MHKNKTPAAVATASGADGFDLAGRQIGLVITTERQRHQGLPLAAPIRIDIAPMARGKWRATIGGEKVCVSAAPMVKAARVLIAEGHDPSSIIELWHQHGEAWALRGKLGAVATTILDGERKAQRHPRNRPLAPFSGKAAKSLTARRTTP